MVEHTDVVYQNLGIADRLLGDLCVNYKFIEGCVQHKHQGHLKLERKLWLRRSIRACELQRDLHVIQVLVAKYDTSGGWELNSLVCLVFSKINAKLKVNIWAVVKSQLREKLQQLGWEAWWVQRDGHDAVWKVEEETIDSWLMNEELFKLFRVFTGLPDWVGRDREAGISFVGDSAI